MRLGDSLVSEVGLPLLAEVIARGRNDALAVMRVLRHSHLDAMGLEAELRDALRRSR